MCSPHQLRGPLKEEQSRLCTTREIILFLSSEISERCSTVDLHGLRVSIRTDSRCHSAPLVPSYRQIDQGAFTNLAEPLIAWLEIQAVDGSGLI